ncbi:MAG: hypothetical protein IKH59_06040 [Bacteroidaceae bacterium]|nr:hypothetical protein [Bacteroidaceae bacterium]
MKHLRRYLPLLALLLMLAGSITSCRDAGVRDALQRAEALMETDLHAARAVLDSLDLQSSSPIPNSSSPISNSSFLIPNYSKRDLALYALLRTQADYKCNIRLTSDSLPLIATNYFGTRRKTQRAALAQHYLGCSYTDMHRDLDAVDAFLRATMLFPDTTNKYFANSLFDLGFLYYTHHMVDSAWVAFTRYRRTEICNSDSMNICYADYYMGSVAIYQEDIELSDSLFRCVECNVKASDYIRNTAYFQLAKLCYYKKHDIEEAIQYLQKIGDYFGEGNGAILSLKADILSEQQQPEKAFELYKKAIRNSSDIYTQCSSYEGLAGLAPLINKGDSTRYFIEQYKALLDTIVTRSQKEKIAEIKDKHVVELHDRQLEARHFRFLSWVGIVTVVFVSGITMTFLLVDRKRKKRYILAQEELRQANVDVLRAQVDEKPADMEALYRKKLDACQNLFSRTSSARLLMLPPTSLTAHQRLTLMDDINHSFVDIMIDVRNSSNGINNQELTYCILSFLKCSTAQMAELLNTTESSLRKRKVRIKEKMPESMSSLFF